jgi:ribonuclease VapC
MIGTTSAVLDASAVLAVLNREPGADSITDAFGDEPVISTVNYAEVISKLVERGGAWQEAVRAVANLALTIIDFDSALAERTGSLRAETKPRGLSLGDRACLALAEREGAHALTCETAWLGAVNGIKIQLVDNRKKA